MIDIKKIGINELLVLVNYLAQHLDDAGKIIKDFGEVELKNGQGTSFLNPRNPLFKVFWIYQENNRIKSVGFGGPHLGLTLKELYSFYDGYKQGFVPYDNQYVYGFFSEERHDHTIRIYSKDPLMNGKNITQNIDIDGLDIYFT